MCVVVIGLTADSSVAQLVEQSEKGFSHLISGLVAGSSPARYNTHSQQHSKEL